MVVDSDIQSWSREPRNRYVNEYLFYNHSQPKNDNCNVKSHPVRHAGQITGDYQRC